MTLSTDIIDRLARSLKPFWHYTQHDVIGDAMAEITKLRAERDAAARDMRERCVQAVKNERLIDHTGAPEDNSYNLAIEHIIEAVEALPLLATQHEGDVT